MMKHLVEIALPIKPSLTTTDTDEIIKFECILDDFSNISNACEKLQRTEFLSIDDESLSTFKFDISN